MPRCRRSSRTVGHESLIRRLVKLQIDEKKKMYERTENYLKNLESIG
jgi:hypothetical protein